MLGLIIKLINNIIVEREEGYFNQYKNKIPSELIESELFGHEKGAFTSAVKDKKGKLSPTDKAKLLLEYIKINIRTTIIKYQYFPIFMSLYLY